MKKPLFLLLATLIMTVAVWTYGHHSFTGIGRSDHTVILICIDACRRDTFTHADEGGIADGLTPWSQKAYRLQNAWSASSWTVPAVGSLLTGRYPAVHGAGNFKTAIANVDNVLPSELSPAVTTIFERLSRVGYQTAAWVDTPWLSRVGLLRGIASVQQTESKAIVPAVLRALNERNWPKRSAIYLHLMDVHDAHRETPSEMREQLARYDARLLADWRRIAPAGVCENASSDRCADFLHYAATVRQTREEIASLLNGLRASGRLDHSTVIVVADHGEAFGEHAASPLLMSDPRLISGTGTGHGQALFEEILDIPMYIWAGDGQGSALTTPASLIDVAPIVTELCGLKRPATLPGLTLSELQRAPQRTLFASGVAYGPPQFAVRSGRWKRIITINPPVSYTFDLENDPDEENPAGLPDVSRTLDVKLLEYTRRTPPQSATAHVEGPDLERLRSLGYLTGFTAPQTGQPKVVPAGPSR
ncbi:MAG TPA: sulfatase-like hydrolase/transferase [Thermoanaerobaculia bacterium]|nr:sulfatase-like hydrolase/transferase [Thermoanaerobaculia bacterium]